MIIIHIYTSQIYRDSHTSIRSNTVGKYINQYRFTLKKKLKQTFTNTVTDDIGKMLGFEANGQERILETSLVQIADIIKAQGQDP